MGLGEKDGEEFYQIKVALIPVLEANVPDEVVLGGHVVVSDHAAVPPRAELLADESSYEMVRGRGCVGGPSSSRDGCGAGLWDGVGRRARADRRECVGGPSSSRDGCGAGLWDGVGRRGNWKVKEK